jgi:predicted small integral membrane protein
MSANAARTAKIAFVGFVGVFGLLTGIDNIIDYPTNFEVVRHVMSMDATPAGNRLMGRAITSETLHQFAYWIIIGTELIYASLCIFGALRLLGAQGSAASFNSAKGPAVAGLAIGFVLYFFGFMVVGGEWFQMWQAGPWNMQEGAFRFIGCIGLVLVFLCLPDADR